MKKFCQLVALYTFATICFSSITYSQPPYYADESVYKNRSVPLPFNETYQKNIKDQAAATTGYYFMTSNSNRPLEQTEGKWRAENFPEHTDSAGLYPLSFEPQLWYRIYSGPRQVPLNERESWYDKDKKLILPPRATGQTPTEGYRYFRNPAQYESYLDPNNRMQGIDSTTNAIAGPIPIGFPFYVNGLRYDSFYVSPRGIVALSNRRYFYDNEGRRAIPQGRNTCYDPMSADWPFYTLDANGNPTTNLIAGRPQLPASMGVNTTNDETEDNYGFVNIACGGDPLSHYGGIRDYMRSGEQFEAEHADGPYAVPPSQMSRNTAPTRTPAIYRRLVNPVNAGGAFLTPLEGPLYLPQYDQNERRVDDFGQVWYKRSMYSDKLIIYFRNLHLEPYNYIIRQNVGGSYAHTYAYVVPPGRANRTKYREDTGCVAVSFQVILDRTDSSVTYRYGYFLGQGLGFTNPPAGGTPLTYPPYYPIQRPPGENQMNARRAMPANQLIQCFTSVAIGGYARHRGYNSKDPQVLDEDNPWKGQYIQYTQDWNSCPPVRDDPNNPVSFAQIQTSKLTSPRYNIKFKQWRNALRVVDVQYFVRKKEDGATNFDVTIKSNIVKDIYDPFELLAGHPQLGHMQPVAVIQNLTNDIQSPSGVNFAEQDFQFQARLLVLNRITDRYAYNRYAKVSEYCLRDFKNEGSPNPLCNQADQYEEIRLAEVTKTIDASGDVYNVTPYTLNDMNTRFANVNGIPPYEFVRVKFPVYSPNEFLENHIGLMRLYAIAEATHPITGFALGDEWPFDDSASVSFWVVNRLPNFRCNSEFNFHQDVGYVPNVNRWVHACFDDNTTSVRPVASGASSSPNPLPPLGLINCLNTNYMNSLLSPMYKYVWTQVARENVGPAGPPPGPNTAQVNPQYYTRPSKLISFPIDMRNRNGSVLTLAVQRASGDAGMFVRGWADETLRGPEARVVFNTLYQNEMKEIDNITPIALSSGKIPQTLFGSNPYASGGNHENNRTAPFDYLAVEYLRPSYDGISAITMTDSLESKNIKNNNHNIITRGTATENLNERWRYHPRWVGNKEEPPMLNTQIVQNAPALAIFGGGGYFVGWTFGDGKAYYPVSWNGANENSTSAARNAIYGGMLVGDVHGGSGIAVINKIHNLLQRQCSTVVSPQNGRDSIVGGLMPNPYDVGFDLEFNRYSVVIPDYYMSSISPDNGKNFRFRIRMIDQTDSVGLGANAGYNGTYISGPPFNPNDDEDEVFVDNVAIMNPNALTDLEAQVVKIILPYIGMPASQATDLTIYGKIGNMGTSNAPPFLVKIRVYRANSGIVPANAIFCRTLTVPQLLAGRSTEISVDGFSPRNFAQNEIGLNSFVLQMEIQHTSGSDLYDLNDKIQSDFVIRFDSVFTYNATGQNNVQDLVDIQGKGLNLGATSFGGFFKENERDDNIDVMSQKIQVKPLPPNNNSAFANGRYWDFWSHMSANENGSDDYGWVGYVCGGNLDGLILGYPNYQYISGQIAMKFELKAADTLKGFRAVFGNANSAFSDISFRVYENSGSLPGKEIGAPLYGRRLVSKSANGQETIVGANEYVLYELPTPIRLERGTYWISIDQLGETGLELAASSASMGMRTMVINAKTGPFGGEIYGMPYESDNPVPQTIGILGDSGIQIMLDKRFRVPVNDVLYNGIMFDRVYQNNNVFAYKNVIGSSKTEWKPFMPTQGQVGYPHLNHAGMMHIRKRAFATFSRGTWSPFLDPYFGKKTIQNDNKAYPCADDVAETNPSSIEVVSFDGYVRNGGIELAWETVTETNNQSFIIERTELNSDEWTEVAVKNGAGNSTTTQIYQIRDEDVVPGTTYKYRLYSMSFDGVISCQNNNIVTVEFEDNRTVALYQNEPNPFSNETSIKTYIPTSQKVTLEILDIFGRTIKTLVNGEVLRGEAVHIWNGRDENGMKVSAGHYLYKLTAGETIITKKLSFINDN